eukprot:746962-Hanusia_phi.AAC.9
MHMYLDPAFNSSTSSLCSPIEVEANMKVDRREEVNQEPGSTMFARREIADQDLRTVAQQRSDQEMVDYCAALYEESAGNRLRCLNTNTSEIVEKRILSESDLQLEKRSPHSFHDFRDMSGHVHVTRSPARLPSPSEDQARDDVRSEEEAAPEHVDVERA